MSLLLNRAKANTATTGTGTVNLGAAVIPFQGWAAAGAVSGLKYSYLIEDGNAWEIGEGVFTSGSPDTLTRVLVASSTGALLNLTGSATVACSAKAGDLGVQIMCFTHGGALTADTTFSRAPVPYAGAGRRIFLLDGDFVNYKSTTGSWTCSLNWINAANVITPLVSINNSADPTVTWVNTNFVLNALLDATAVAFSCLADEISGSATTYPTFNLRYLVV